MDAHIDPRISTTARNFLEETTMKSLLGISDDALDAVSVLAYQLHRAGRDAEVAVLCRGLIAADHTAWWPYSLYAAALRRLGRQHDALAQLERGLARDPSQPKLLAMHADISATLTPHTAVAAAA